MNHLLTPNRIITGARYATPEAETITPLNTTINTLITPTQLIYAVINQNSKKLVYLQPYQFPGFANASGWLHAVEEIFDTDTWLKKEVASKKTAVFTPCFTLVPSGFDNEKSRVTLLKTNCLVDPEDMIYSDQLTSQKTNLLFALPRNLIQLCSHAGSNYPNHSLTSLIDQIITESPDSDKDQLFIYFQSDSFQLIWISHKMLRYCNSFLYRSPEDFMYYLLFACKQLRIDPELVAVSLMGEVVRDSIIFNLLTKYIRNVDFVKPCKLLQFDSNYPLPHYFFYNLFCI